MKSILHHRKPGVKPTHVFMVGGKVLTEEEAYEIHFQVQKLNDRLDVESYAENGYGSCDDPKIAAKVMKYAGDIAKVYRDKLDYGENWFHPLEMVVEDYIEWEVS